MILSNLILETTSITYGLNPQNLLSENRKRTQRSGGLYIWKCSKANLKFFQSPSLSSEANFFMRIFDALTQRMPSPRSSLLNASAYFGHQVFRGIHFFILLHLLNMNRKLAVSGMTYYLTNLC